MSTHIYFSLLFASPALGMEVSLGQPQHKGEIGKFRVIGDSLVSAQQVGGLRELFS